MNHQHPARRADGCRKSALKYLAPYIFRLAISNRRNLKLADERVTFHYRATDTGQELLYSEEITPFLNVDPDYLRSGIQIRKQKTAGQRPTIPINSLIDCKD